MHEVRPLLVEHPAQVGVDGGDAVLGREGLGACGVHVDDGHDLGAVCLRPEGGYVADARDPARSDDRRPDHPPSTFLIAW